jgi:hypothetical protein
MEEGYKKIKKRRYKIEKKIMKHGEQNGRSGK